MDLPPPASERILSSRTPSRAIRSFENLVALANDQERLRDARKMVWRDRGEPAVELRTLRGCLQHALKGALRACCSPPRLDILNALAGAASLAFGIRSGFNLFVLLFRILRRPRCVPAPFARRCCVHFPQTISALPPPACRPRRRRLPLRRDVGYVFPAPAVRSVQNPARQGYSSRYTSTSSTPSRSSIRLLPMRPASCPRHTHPRSTIQSRTATSRSACSRHRSPAGSRSRRRCTRSGSASAQSGGMLSWRVPLPAGWA